jgi:hydroxypyruvate reductase 1
MACEVKGIGMDTSQWQIHNESGDKRVIVTKSLPGDRWIEILISAGCRVEVCTSSELLSTQDIKAAIGDRCHGAIGQLTESWGEALFTALKGAGGIAYSNLAVGFDNVDVSAATRIGIPVGNTPGVLTETTAEMAVALTFAAARRLGEAERYLRSGRFHGWLPTLFVGELLQGKTIGIVGAGRIGAAYGRMMMAGHQMNLLYYSRHSNETLEDYVSAYSRFLVSQGEAPVQCRRTETLEELLKEADCVSIHTTMNKSTHHLINAERLAVMKKNAILVNTSRGPVIDENALVAHCRKHSNFRVGLDVFEEEPVIKPGLLELDNVVLAPHIASATVWTRSGMATLAAGNVAGMILNYPVWNRSDILPFLTGTSPKAAPSILNAKELHLPLFKEKKRI